MKKILRASLGIFIACSGIYLAGCADSNAQLQRPAPYRPTAAPASNQSPDFAMPKTSK